MASKESHKRYTIEFKLAVVDWMKHHSSSYRAAAKQFGVDRKMVREWMNNRAEYVCALRKHGPQRCRVHGGRPPLSEELDQAVLQYLNEERAKGRPVSDRDLQTKGVEASKLFGIDNFKGTMQWLRKWKKRNDVAYKDGSNQHQPPSPCRVQREEVLESGQAKGDALLSHIEPREQVKLERMKKKKSCKQKPFGSTAVKGSDSKFLDTPSASSASHEEGRTPIILVPSNQGGSTHSSQKGLPPQPLTSDSDGEEGIMLDFSAPEHSYCLSDCFIEEEMIGQLPLSGSLEANAIVHTISQEGIVESIALHQQRDLNLHSNGSEFSLCVNEDLPLGNEVTVASSNGVDMSVIVNKILTEHRRLLVHEGQLFGASLKTAATSSSPFSPNATSTALRSSDHSYSLSGHLSGLEPSSPLHSCEPLGVIREVGHCAAMTPFTSSSCSLADHDYELTLLGRTSPQLSFLSPPLPPFASVLPTTQQSSFLQDFHDAGNLGLHDPGSGILARMEGGMYLPASGTAAPIVYVDRPSSPPCAISTR